jgi:hypothetical protein
VCWSLTVVAGWRTLLPDVLREFVAEHAVRVPWLSRLLRIDRGVTGFDNPLQ